MNYYVNNMSRSQLTLGANKEGTLGFERDALNIIIQNTPSGLRVLNATILIIKLITARIADFLHAGNH